jgi:hypothetical protein
LTASRARANAATSSSVILPETTGTCRYFSPTRPAAAARAALSA